jgi:hypothetical protein
VPEVDLSLAERVERVGRRDASHEPGVRFLVGEAAEPAAWACMNINQPSRTCDREGGLMTTRPGYELDSALSDGFRSCSG